MNNYSRRIFGGATWFSFCLLTCFCSLGNLHAQHAWQKKIKPLQGPAHPILKPVRLNYNLSWNGTVNSGQATITFGVKDKRYKNYYAAQASGRSTGVAATLFPYAFSYTEVMRKKSCLPLVFVSHEVDKRGTQKVRNTYKKNQVIHQVTNIKKKDGKTRGKKHTYAQANTLGPLSAMLYIRNRPLKNGDKIHLSIHPFKSPQYAVVTVLGREMHRGRPCIKLDLKLNNVDKKTMKLKKYNKMKKATLWISDDKDRVLVELRSRVFIGDVRMVLTKQQNL